MRVPDTSNFLLYNPYTNTDPPSGCHGGHSACDPWDIDFPSPYAPKQMQADPMQQPLALLMQLILGLLAAAQRPGGDPGSGAEGGGLHMPKTLPQTYAADPGSSGSFAAGPNDKLQQWSGAISNASAITGFDPNLIGGQIWAESRGDASASSTNADGTTDLSLMQISQARWKRDILPNLSEEQKQKIKQVTGKDASELDMSNPEHNVIGGALELKQWVDNKGGNLREGLRFYVSCGDPSIGSPTYVDDVLNFAEILKSGGRLPP